MMRTFLQYLWKEWRDARAIILGIAVAIPLLLAGAKLLLPSHSSSGAVFVNVATWGSLALAVLAFATDLFAGEVRRNRMRFLARLPAGLGVVFAAKLLMLLLTVPGFTLYGYVWSSMLTGWPELRLDETLFPVALGFYAVPWIFAASCWLPRGALAVPAGALVLALFSLPIYLAHLWFPEYKPEFVDFAGAALVTLIGAFFATGFSFIRGYRHGGGFLAAGWRGLLVLLVFFVPVYGYGGYRMQEWYAFDPLSREFHLEQMIRSSNERFYYLTGRMVQLDGRKGPHRMIVFDAGSGDWEAVGPIGSAFAGRDGFTSLGSQSLVHHFDYQSQGTHGTWRTLYDANEGRAVAQGWSGLPDERWTNAVPEYRRGWRRVGSAGLGFVVWRKRHKAIEDPFRERIYRVAKPSRIIVLRHHWILRRDRYDKPRYEILEPGSERGRPIERDGAIIHYLPDGRVLWLDKEDNIAILDLDTNVATPVEVDPTLKLTSSQRGGWFRTWNGEEGGWASLDVASARIVPAENAPPDFVGFFPNWSSIVGIARGKILRVHAANGGVEQIFPPVD
ncbi:MAG: hypothetical protein AAGD14_07135 [Planctomycetota bacterium]